MRNARAVALAINSPGGSAAQSHLIYRRIRALADEKKLPVIAFVEDVGASGGYMIACAADEIVCDASSIVGSIGVVGGSFGFAQADREDRRRAPALHVGRAQGDARSVPAGEAGGRGAAQGDPARNPRELHRAGEGRAAAASSTAAKAPCSPANTGPATRAQELGLVDAIGDLRSVLRERYGDKVRTPLIAERGLFGRRLPGVAAAASSAVAAAEPRRGCGLDARGARALGALRTVEESDMPMLHAASVVWMLGAVGAVLVTKLLGREWQRVNAELDRTRPRRRSTNSERAGVPTLQRDPVTGDYRPTASAEAAAVSPAP